MITKLINRIDFAFLISILVSLCGLWMFLYNMIIEHTSVDSYAMALSLSVCHYAVTIYIIVLVYICFHKSLAIIKDDKLEDTNKFADVIISIFLKTWPFVIIFSLLIIVVYLVGFSEDVGLFINFLLVTVLLFVLFFVLFVKSVALKKIHVFIVCVLSSVMILFGFFVFLVVMSNSSMALTVNTDKDYYTYADKELVLTIDTKGYLFRPIHSVEEDDYFPREVNKYGGCYWVSLEGLETNVFDPTISVEYQNCMFLDNKWLKGLMSKKVIYKDIFYKKKK